MNKPLTITELIATSEIWYTRLNNLKRWLHDNPDHWKRYKAANLAAQLALRLLNVANIYKDAVAPKLNYPAGTPENGGVTIVGERGQETMFINGKESIIPSK